MALSQINNPRYIEEIHHFRGLSNLQETLETMMKDTQGCLMEVMKELVTVQGQLDLCKKMLEISNAYKELDHPFCLANPVCIHHCQSPVQSPLVEPPRVIRAIVLLPSHARGPVEMPVLQDVDPDHCRVTRCCQCNVVGHVVSQCPKKGRNGKCTICGGTHKPAKFPVRAHTTSPKVVTQVFGKVVQHEEMLLLEHIVLLDHIKYSPSHCAKCGCQNPEHLEMEYPMYKQ